MPPMKLPNFLQRKNSKRRGRREEFPVPPPPLSPVSEHPIPVPRSPSPLGRPVPPPQHVLSHADDFEHDDMHHDDYMDALHEPHSRMYETFTPSQDGHIVPQVIREGDGSEHFHHLDTVPSNGHMHHIDHPDGLGSMHADELGMVDTERSVPNREGVYITPSEQSGSSHSSNQRVTFMGDMPSHDRGTPSVHQRVLSTSARGMHSRERRRGVPAASSSLRYDYGSPRRYGSDYRTLNPPKMKRPDHPYDFEYPYLILSDFGEGLEIGNEKDGFMRYEDYCETAYLRSGRQATYYVIPGSTPVVFNDEDGHELYRVDAWKYYTPWLRRRQYIVQDEDGRELFRVGGSDGRSSSDGSYSSRSHDRVTYLPSDIGSNMHRRRPKYKNKRLYHAATPLTRSALFEEDDRTVSSQVSSSPDIIVVNEDGERIYDSRNSTIGAQSPLTRSQYITEASYPSRPDSEFIDEYGRPVDRSRSPEYRWDSSGTSSTECDDYDEGSRRRSRVFEA